MISVKHVKERAVDLALLQLHVKLVEDKVTFHCDRDHLLHKKFV